MGPTAGLSRILWGFLSSCLYGAVKKQDVQLVDSVKCPQHILVPLCMLTFHLLYQQHGRVYIHVVSVDNVWIYRAGCHGLYAACAVKMDLSPLLIYYRYKFPLKNLGGYSQRWRQRC